MISDLYLLQGMAWRSIQRKLEHTTQVPLSVWQVGRGANSAVAVQYEGSRWVEGKEVGGAVKALARDHNLSLNINMEQYR